MSKRTARHRRRAMFVTLLGLSAALLLPSVAFTGPPNASPGPRLLQSPRIREIQGVGHISPVANAEVSGVTGVVTAKRAGGFLMQGTAPDAHPRTSEGIFVSTTAAPADMSPGDSVRVGGTVKEQRQGGDATTNANLSITQIAASS